MPTKRTTQPADSGRVHDFRAPRYRRHGHSAAQRLRHRDQIGLDAEMLGRKPLAGARKTRLHFVGDEQDSVFAADRMNRFEVVARRNDEAPLAENRLGNYGGDRFSRDGTLERVFKMVRECFRSSRLLSLRYGYANGMRYTSLANGSKPAL